MNVPLLYALGICAASATLEGILAGRGVKQWLSELRLPRYSPPLRVWFVIGGVFYVICFVVLYRLFSLSPSGRRDAALALLIGMMVVNALWNYVFFRARNLRLSFVAFLPYGFMAIALLVLTWKLDRVAALSLLPYVVYLGYGGAWGYGIWKLNSDKGARSAS